MKTQCFRILEDRGIGMYCLYPERTSKFLVVSEDFSQFQRAHGGTESN